MSTDRPTRAWVEVQAGAIRRNFATIEASLGPGGKVIPMLKANAYGLGAQGAAQALEPMGPWGFGVATVAEGRELRELGVDRPVLVCSPVPQGAYQMAVEHDLTLCLSDLEGVRHLGSVVDRMGSHADFQIEVDTGMGRAGFDWREAAGWGAALQGLVGANLRWTGCFTHLHSADEAEIASVTTQGQRLRDALERLDTPPDGFLVHVANSAGALRCPDALPPVARAGIFLYGGRAGVGLPAPEPVASLRARVVFLRDASPGTTLGYGATYSAGSWERWATIAVGYGDGVPRALGNRGHVILGGQRAPIIGRVSMDMVTANISELTGVELGDVATLIGREGGEEISVDEVAERSGTIAYEILTGLTARLPRIWVDDGET